MQSAAGFDPKPVQVGRSKARSDYDEPEKRKRDRLAAGDEANWRRSRPGRCWTEAGIGEAAFRLVDADMTDPACLPPTGTARDTLHWILHDPTNQMHVMRWHDPVWFEIANPCELYANDLGGKGYRYWEPCIPPNWSGEDAG